MRHVRTSNWMLALGASIRRRPVGSMIRIGMHRAVWWRHASRVLSTSESVTYLAQEGAAMVVRLSMERLGEECPEFSDVFYAERVRALADARSIAKSSAFLLADCEFGEELWEPSSYVRTSEWRCKWASETTIKD
jgi:hypothetical protein